MRSPQKPVQCLEGETNTDTRLSVTSLLMAKLNTG